jgi:uncharacterized protein (DUF1800 family)
MGTRNLALVALTAVFALGATTMDVSAADPPPIGGLRVTVTNLIKTVTWPRAQLPALETNLLRSGTNINNMAPVLQASITANTNQYVYRTVNTFPRQFYSLQLMQMSSEDLLRANVLNRLAYGPTPDDLEAVAADPEAYIAEQLAPQSIPGGDYDAYSAVYTNSINSGPNTNWTLVSVTGIVSSSVLYMYLRGVGEQYIDDVQLRVLSNVVSTNYVTNQTTMEVSTNYMTNTVAGPNVLVNGDFEGATLAPWTVAPNLIQSHMTNDYVCEGAKSLRMISTAPGSTDTSSIRQQVTPALPNNARCVLSFAYLPNPNSGLLTIRLSGSGIIISGMDELPPPSWIYETVTGRSTGSRFLYAYISGAGEAWIDDLKLVWGSDANAGPDLLQNGDFESAFVSPWFAVGNHSSSGIDNTVAKSGAGSLRLMASGGGSGNGTNGNSVVQMNVPVTNNGIYTISYWYRPSPQGRAVTVRLSGQPPDQSPDREPAGLRRRLDAANWSVALDEMRRWHCHNAVGSPRQLMEVLTQFFENHFVTYHSKTADYFDRYYDGGILDRIATDLEFREVSRWKQALLNPNCTFYDLLKIHVESPAQIIYLDTVESRGDGNRIANENYARELFELFAMGVDNGYDQNDIVAMSRAWTGWTVDIVDRDQINNPFAPRSGQYGQYPGVGFNQVSNIVGVWSFVFNPAWHGTNRAPILSEWVPNTPATNPVAQGPKRYAARFGPPWAGQPYQIAIPRRTGTNSIQDGYDVIRALSVNIHTAEYLSVKLCRIFVHDEFPNPTTHSDLPEYAYYNYTNPNRTPEAELVRRCIVAWDTPGPDGRKGHIRAVLRTIFDSDLFRSHAGSRQKVKTPLEFVISAARALRSVDAGGVATASTDGNFASALSRMGQMSLFNRADPDGYPENGPPWVSAGTLAERLRFVQALLIAPGGSGRGDAGNNTTDPVGLLKRKLPSSSWDNSSAVADFFLTVLFFGEGRANLDLYRNSAINFLNTADDGITSSPFGSLGNTSTAYDTRVRGMVGMLMTLQRFQEQ